MTARTLLHFWDPRVLRGLLAASGMPESPQMLSRELEVVEVAPSPLLKDFWRDALRCIPANLLRIPMEAQSSLSSSYSVRLFISLSLFLSPTPISLISQFSPSNLNIPLSPQFQILLKKLLNFRKFYFHSKSIFPHGNRILEIQHQLFGKYYKIEVKNVKKRWLFD